MKKIVLSRLFLYKYRFFIGFGILGLVFAALVFLMPLVTPGGINREEMASVVSSEELSFSTFAEGNVVDLPFRLLQRLSVSLFGLTSYSVKLPAIVVGSVTGALLILLLNRWFKTNVALLASLFVAMSAFFLLETGTGTPTVMFLFWTVLALWLGAKLVGEKNPKYPLVLALVATLALSCYSPLFVYLVVLVGIVVVTQPHLRFFIKYFKKWQIGLAGAIFFVLLAPLVFGAIVNGATLQRLVLSSGGDYLVNIETAYAPFFAFGASSVGAVLSPLFGMATAALVVIGLITSVGKFSNSRSVVTGALVFFAIVASGLNPHMSLVMFVPILLLVASGIEFTINRWYDLFPENPYARLFGVAPIALFVGISLASGMTHYFYGYRSVPAVAREFSDDLDLVREYVPSGGVLIVGDEDDLALRFFKILEHEEDITVSDDLPDRAPELVATLGRWDGEVGLPLHEIITSSKASESDRLYIYKKL